MITNRLPIHWTLALLGLGMTVAVGCRRISPEASFEGLPQACCTKADGQLQNFAGCRIPRRNCKSKDGEKWWMRGSIQCGPIDEANCEGGRCCSYTPQYDADLSEPIENWAPPGHDKPTNNVTDPDAKPQHDVPLPEEKKAAPSSETPPEPAAQPQAPDAPAEAAEPTETETETAPQAAAQ